MKHYIIMSSSYNMGKRIALDYIINQENSEKLKQIYRNIINECGEDVSISTHFIETDSKYWDSVRKKDYYFKEVKLINSVDRFIKLIKKDRSLEGLDIAKYILCRFECTHLKLEKLVYLCYAEYLCTFDKDLYIDNIYAYKYGPIVKSVYDKYKGKKEDLQLDIAESYTMSSRSRILFAEDGANKINVIDKTLDKYGNLTAGELVTLTHKENSPWDVSGRGEEKNQLIERKIIKEYHCNEIIDNC